VEYTQLVLNMHILCLVLQNSCSLMYILHAVCSDRIVEGEMDGVYSTHGKEVRNVHKIPFGKP